ncbi:MAG: hypothetical protein KID00_02455 [Clostridium argentinense]|uniref:Gluconokinase n=1 Tax=Clostridium faecium TaxID=2762223 RepID=A0ABR8YSF8_9CLOT|nr:hypothetical protein [Clostridium faecium]MBD8047163.1 hypothetical protein [Clostridium faecium]MBS5822717.1 hypothetical protein [Clostridium argentinense]MDU1348458.1 hypothetical protein [Clostridium argentinense]
MLFIFMGASCTGKSSAADDLKELIDVQIYTGKDYLRMAKNEDEAWKIFSKKLNKASSNKDLSCQSIIYVVSEKSILPKLQSINDGITIKFTANLDVVKSRFATRMKGNLPNPVEKMLERQLIDWKDIDADLCIDTTNEEIKEVAKKIYNFAKK